MSTRVTPCGVVVALVLAARLVVALGGCAAVDVATPRGTVTAADGTILAETHDGRRTYPFGTLTAALVGSVITEHAPAGIEQSCGDALLAGQDVTLTIDMATQQAAADALGAHTGAIVVLDLRDAAMLALASAPTYDPAATNVSATALVNRATTLYVPGSTFKTVTLAAALEGGMATLDEHIPGPDVITFADGTVTNYDLASFDGTLAEAYAHSTNTVFAQLALRVGSDAIATMSSRVGFGASPMNDVAVAASTFAAGDDMTPLAEAWAGIGETTVAADGSLRGPLMSAVQGAALAATVARGGHVAHPYVVASGVDGDDNTAGTGADGDDRAFSFETADQLARCMRLVVTEGTGTTAAVAGVDVGGKTGTTRTASGDPETGWFIGFARAGDVGYAVAVVLEGVASSEAAAVAGTLIGQLASV